MKEFRKILKYARPYTKSLVFAFICLTLTSLVNLVLPLIVRNMINAVVILKDSQILDGLAWDLFFIIILQAVFAVTHNYVFGFVGHRMTTDFRIEFFSHIQSLSLRFFQERRVGEILSRMNSDISVIQNALVTIPVALLRQSITLIGAMAIILYLNWKLTGLIFLILPPLMIFARIFGKRLRLFAEKLQDQVPPFATETAREIIEASLGSPLESKFSDFDPIPLASASLAQIHTARLNDKTGDHEIVIKVIRPDVLPVIEKDIRLMYFVARLLEGLWPEAERLHPVHVVRDYETTILGELDLTREATNTIRLRENWYQSGKLYVPRVFEKYSNKNMMVMERIYGVTATDLEKLNGGKVNLN